MQCPVMHCPWLTIQVSHWGKVALTHTNCPDLSTMKCQSTVRRTCVFHRHSWGWACFRSHPLSPSFNAQDDYLHENLSGLYGTSYNLGTKFISHPAMPLAIAWLMLWEQWMPKNWVYKTPPWLGPGNKREGECLGQRIIRVVLRRLSLVTSTGDIKGDLKH